MSKSLSHYFALPGFYKKYDRNLRLIYALRICRDLISRVVLFFLPIFFFQLGSSSSLFNFIPVSEFQRGMLTIGIYYILSNIIGASIAIPASTLVQRLNSQKTLLLSFVFLFANLVALYYLSLQASISYYLLAALFNGIQSQFFWVTYFTLLSRNTKFAQMGKNLGSQQILLQIVSVIAPAISGTMALMLGFESLFVIGMALVLLAVIIVMLMENNKLGFQASWREFFRWLGEWRYRRFVVSVIGGAAYDNVVFVWPLYVFVLLGSIEKVGYLYSISLFLAMLVTFFTSVYIDKSRSRKPFVLSGWMLSAIWLLRTQIATVWGIVASEVADRLSANAYKLFFDTAIIRRGKGNKAFAYFIYREVIVNSTAVGFWLLFSGFFLLDGGWTELFIIASVGTILSLLVKDSRGSLK